MRPQLPPLPSESTERHRVCRGASGVLDELDLLILDLRRVQLDEAANRVEVARAIVHKECSGVLMMGRVWREEETAELREAGNG